MKSYAMLTDPYELTMAYGYWKLGMAEREAVFHLFYRTAPFGGSYVVAAGLAKAIELVENFSFTAEDCEYLAGLGLFEPEFLTHLQGLQLQVDLDAIEEGSLAFPHAPLVRVRGPLLQAQILETALLNIFNFQSLIATKAARVRYVVGGDELLEFGLRRAQGFDGGMSASRAAYLGGCDAVSNLMAGKEWGIPVRGTHAHSWVMAFDDEQESFEGYARVLPKNAIFLVDTYDSLEGVRKAIAAAGDKLKGIRLDSGDLERLAKGARKLLDEAGLPDAKIVASNELDEWRIKKLKSAGAPIDVWGVGTRLSTGHPDGALDGVYKLSAIRGDDGQWRYKAKRSDQSEKTSPPGVLQVHRYADGDVIVDVEGPFQRAPTAISPNGERRKFEGEFDEVLVPVFRAGKRVYELPTLEESRSRAMEQVGALPAAISKIEKPKPHFVGTEENLHATVQQLLGRR